MERISKKTDQIIDKLYQVRPLSRREFMKVVGVGLGVIGVGSLGIVAEVRGSSIKRFAKEYLLYSYEGIRRIDNVERALQLTFPLPGEAYNHGNYGRTDISPGPNIPWEKEELVFLDRLVNKLPGIYKRAEKKAFIARYPFRNNYYGGSWISPDKISIFAPRVWNPTGIPEFPKIWHTNIQEFDAKITHELTHRVMDERQSLLERYAKATGWRKEHGKWINESDFGVIDRMCDRNRGPSEDASWAAAIFVTAPSKLLTGSKPDAIRYNFISRQFR